MNSTTTTLSPQDFTDFWIRLYLGATDDLTNACIDRAYRDFSRTLHGIKGKRTDEKYAEIKQTILQSIKEITKAKKANQDEFDKWHNQQCEKLQAEFSNLFTHHLYYGQAQKWINMTLKYLFALQDKVEGISKNYQFFHIPIDNIIQEKFAKSTIGIKKIKTRWSRMNYDDYIRYQKEVRKKFNGQIPMDIEFKEFNKAK